MTDAEIRAKLDELAQRVTDHHGFITRGEAREIIGGKRLSTKRLEELGWTPVPNSRTYLMRYEAPREETPADEQPTESEGEGEACGWQSGEAVSVTTPEVPAEPVVATEVTAGSDETPETADAAPPDEPDDRLVAIPEPTEEAIAAWQEAADVCRGSEAHRKGSIPWPFAPGFTAAERHVRLCLHYEALAIDHERVRRYAELITLAWKQRIERGLAKLGALEGAIADAHEQAWREGTAPKTIVTPGCSSRLSEVEEALVCEDKQAALEHARKARTAIKVVERLDAREYHAWARRQLDQTGELLPGMKVEPACIRVTVRPGKAAQKGEDE